MAMALTPENDLDSLTCMEFTRSQDAVDTTLGEGIDITHTCTLVFPTFQFSLDQIRSNKKIYIYSTEYVYIYIRLNNV